jgi:tetratricopeptide (TPR) repeat protein
MIRVAVYMIALLLTCLELGAQPDKLAALQAWKLRLQGAGKEEKSELLNKIARGYIQSSSVQSDSGYKYARAAYQYAIAHGFKRNACAASELYSRVLLQLSKANDGLQQYRITRALAEETGNQFIRAVAIRNIGQSLWYQGHFKESIDTILLSADLFKKMGDTYGLTDATVTISSIYGNMGYYEKAFEYAQQGLRLGTQYKDRSNTVLSLIQIGYLYNNTGDHATAHEYYRKAAQRGLDPDGWPYRYLSVCKGDMYMGRQLYDSAWYCYQQSLSGNVKSKLSKTRIGQYFVATKQFDSAKRYFEHLYDELKAGGEGHLSIYAGLGLAEVHAYYRKYDAALLYASEALRTGTERNATVIIRDACRVLSNIYEQLQQPEKSLMYYKQYVAMKDVVVSDQFKGRLSEFRRIADDEKQRSQVLIAEQQLRKNQILRNFLAAGIVFLLLLGLVVFWNISLKRKNEKLRNKSLQAEWQRTAADLEMQALRARMNPHFIFNCLTSINRFILKHEADKASDYLTRFSRLMRLVLINSQKQWISLEEEIEMLTLYLGMERLRFMNAFEYHIHYAAEVDLTAVKVPPLLLQPFCENAIWHGLMHKEGHGYLSISFEMKQQFLYCTITDNGIGREQSALLKPTGDERSKSMGLRMSSARLALFNEDEAMERSCEVVDLKNEQGHSTGTQVILKIKNEELSNTNPDN